MAEPDKTRIDEKSIVALASVWIEKLNESDMQRLPYKRSCKHVCLKLMTVIVGFGA